MVGVILIAVWTICFIHINRTYPQADLIRVELGEPLQYGPYTVTVNQAYMEDTITLYEESGLSTVDEVLPEITLVCSVTIKRTNSDRTDKIQSDLKISHVAAISGAWSNMVDTGELYKLLNEGAVALDQLQEGERQTYLLPFGIWSGGLSSNSLEHLGKRSFTLQLSLYPQKCEILVA